MQSIKSRLFPYKENLNINQLLIDHDSIYYISTPNDALQITSIIYNFCIINNINILESTIIDTTACVGGNTISFGLSNLFKKIIALEIDKLRFDYLVNNTCLYKLENVKCFNSNFLDVINTAPVDIVFIDPPWGGSGYKQIQQLRITIEDRNKNNISLEKICINILLSNKNVKFICLKLPNNYDLEYFYNQMAIVNKTVYLYELVKMSILIIK